MSFRNSVKILAITVLIYPCSITAEPAWLLRLEQSLEDRLLVRLEQAQKDSAPKPFTTDGCSGGLSEGWVLLAQALPRFADKFGDKPVWEDCCVAHDRSYWRGASAEGFDQRLRADMELRGCVQGYGPRLAPELGARHGISEATVISIFSAAGEMMYQAVRAGGKPCTFLPWRWGYGWPQCPLVTSASE
jgi:hypothetical protein